MTDEVNMKTKNYKILNLLKMVTQTLTSKSGKENTRYWGWCCSTAL